MQLSEAAFKGLMRADLEYGSFVWEPQGVVLQVELENGEAEPAARFVICMYYFKQGTIDLGV